jgi:hypothetical protein
MRVMLHTQHDGRGRYHQGGDYESIKSYMNKLTYVMIIVFIKNLPRKTFLLRGWKRNNFFMGLDSSASFSLDSLPEDHPLVENVRKIAGLRACGLSAAFQVQTEKFAILCINELLSGTLPLKTAFANVSGGIANLTKDTKYYILIY